MHPLSKNNYSKHRSFTWLQEKYAEIAQLVEHDLAKVGVASSSLVFRSFFFALFVCEAQMAELVDACVSGAHAARCAGSSPVLGTTNLPKGSNGVPANLICGESGGTSCPFIKRSGINIAILLPNASAGGEIGIHATLRG